MTTDIVKKTEKAPATSDTAALIEAITKASRDPKVNIDKMQFLLDTRRAMLDEEALVEWRDAMTAAQAEMRPINKDLANPQTRSRYSSLAALDTAIRPIYSSHGFAVTFDTEPWEGKPEHILVVAYAERSRHSRRYQIPMPADGKGPQGRDVMSKTHATGSAVSYGRRYLLCMIFNLITADDDGNRASGYHGPPGDRADNYVEPRAEHTRQAMGQAKTKDDPPPAIDEKELAELKKLMVKAGVALTGEQAICEFFSVESLQDLNLDQFEDACRQLRARAKEPKP